MKQIDLLQRCADLEEANEQLRVEVQCHRNRLADFDKLVELLRELLGVQ